MKPSLILATQPIDDYCREILGRFGTIRIAQDMKEQTLAGKIQTAVALVARGQAPITHAGQQHVGLSAWRSFATTRFGLYFFCPDSSLTHKLAISFNLV